MPGAPQAALSLPQVDRGEKVRWETGGIRQFTKAEVRGHTCIQVKEKTQIFYLLLPISRKCLVTSPEAGLQHASWLLQKANAVNNKYLHFLLFIAFIHELTLYDMEYSFGKFGSSVLGVSYPKIFPTSAYR